MPGTDTLLPLFWWISLELHKQLIFGTYDPHFRRTSMPGTIQTTDNRNMTFLSTSNAWNYMNSWQSELSSCHVYKPFVLCFGGIHLVSFSRTTQTADNRNILKSILSNVNAWNYRDSW
jgi:hypothetical protein